MAEVFVARLGEVAIAPETTKGTKVVDATLVDGTWSKHRVYNLRYDPDVQIHERTTAAATLSRYPHLVGRTLGKISFETELRKTAAAGTQDADGSMFRAAGIFISAGVMTPTSDQSQHKTLTMYAMLGSDGTAAPNSVRFGLRGAMANLTLTGEVGHPVMLAWEFFGVSDRDDVDGTPTNTFALKPTDDALNTITHETGIPAVFQGVAFTWGGATKRLGRFELALNNTVVPRDDVSSDEGCLHYVITNRNPVIRIDPDAGLVADGNCFLDTLNAGTEVAVGWALVQASPSRTCTFAAPKAQITECTDADRNGFATKAITAALNKSAEPGDDEFSMTWS